MMYTVYTVLFRMYIEYYNSVYRRRLYNVYNVYHTIYILHSV